MQTTSLYGPVLEGLERVKDNLAGMVQARTPLMERLLAHVLDTPGKAIRPAITLLASGFHPNDGSKAVVMATAVELLHIASLIHDDTVDNSDIRRGKATVSRLWGPRVAVLLGDYLFASSAIWVCDTGNIRVIRRFSQTIMELASGELGETESAYDWRQGRQRYFERIYNKTASLFTTAGESGAVLSGAPEETVQALKSYGYNLGMAFQIVDDILDFDGRREEVGKPVGSDLAQGTITLPAIVALEMFPQDNPVERFCTHRREEDLRQAVAVVQRTEVLETAHAVAEGYCRKALQALEDLPRNDHRRALEDVVHYVLTRRH